MEESHGFFHSACLKLNGSVRKTRYHSGSVVKTADIRDRSAPSAGQWPFSFRNHRASARDQAAWKNSKVHGIFAEFDIRKGIAVGIIEHTCNNMFLAVCQPDRVLGMEIAGLAVQF